MSVQGYKTIIFLCFFKFSYTIIIFRNSFRRLIIVFNSTSPHSTIWFLFPIFLLSQAHILFINVNFAKEFINKCIERFILKGRIKNLREIDAVISGKVNDLLFITNKEVKDLVNKYIDIKTTGLHIGPLFIQPHTRNLNYNEKYEKYRYCVQIKWFNFFDQVIEYKNNLVSIGK